MTTEQEYRQPPIGPEQVEQAIREISTRITKGVKICAERYETYLAADRAYDQAYAEAILSAPGAIGLRRFHAEIATKDEREARDVADAAYRYADRRARALENELRAYQSVGASVRAMYQVAGRGEW